MQHQDRGDLQHDLTLYVRRLLSGIRARGQPGFLQVLLSATRQPATAAQVRDVVEPRIAQFQAMLDAAGVTRIDAIRLIEIIIAPAYFWAQLGAPLDPEHDTPRLVDTALLASRG